jgi:hypothetical protein
VNETPTQREVETAWKKLRQRKVFQWGIAYIAGAWGLLQGVAYMRDTFGWSHQFQQAATVLLIVGLPIALVLAWYHGHRAEHRVTGIELGLLTLLFALGGGIFWYSQTIISTPEPSSHTLTSTAPASYGRVHRHPAIREYERG